MADSAQKNAVKFMTTCLTIPDFSVSPDCLKNKVIVVTGASSGIGRAVAVCCAEHGATVVLIGRSMPALEHVYDEIESKNLPTPAIFQLDFEQAKQADFDGLHNAIKNEFDQIDGVVHNAAQLGSRKPIAQYSFDEWQKIFQINVHATFGLTRHLLPLINTQKPGRIVFTLSEHALTGKAYSGAYSASNGANINLMQTLAEEYEHTQIKVNAIIPCATRTKIRAEAYPAENPASLPHPSQVAQNYLYLLSDNTAAEHGKVFHISTI